MTRDSDSGTGVRAVAPDPALHEPSLSLSLVAPGRARQAPGSHWGTSRRSRGTGRGGKIYTLDAESLCVRAVQAAPICYCPSPVGVLSVQGTSLRGGRAWCHTAHA